MASAHLPRPFRLRCVGRTFGIGAPSANIGERTPAGETSRLANISALGLWLVLPGGSGRVVGGGFRFGIGATTLLASLSSPEVLDFSPNAPHALSFLQPPFRLSLRSLGEAGVRLPQGRRGSFGI